MLVVILALALVGIGLAGIRYAPAIVTAQRREGMAPLEDSEDDVIDETDRVRATRGTGVVFVLVGIVLFAYGVF